MLADENVPKPLIKVLRQKTKVIWVTEEFRGIKDRELVEKANELNEVILTMDNDFLRQKLRRMIKTGVIYVAEDVTKENINALAINILKSLRYLKKRRALAIVYSDRFELYPL